MVELLEEVFIEKNLSEFYNLPQIPDLPANIAPTEKQNKEEAIQTMRTRFEISNEYKDD